MRVMLTVVDPERQATADVLLDAGADATVADVAPGLASAVGREVEGRTVRAGGSAAETGGKLLDLVARVRERQGVDVEGHELFVAGSRLDPGMRVADSQLREGAVVSVGDPRGCPAGEPAGVVEVRVVGGSGAGQVHRLGIGEFTVGSDPGATINLPDRQLPGTAVRLEVDRAGGVTLRPTQESVRLHGLERPADSTAGPVVVPGMSGEEATTTVVDPVQVPALVELDRVPVDDETAWASGGMLTVGTSLLALADVEERDASLSVDPEGVTLDFNRPPRLLPPERRTEFALPTEPGRPQRQSFPLVMMLLPLVAAIAIVLFTGRWYFLIFGLLSPLMYLGQYLTSKRQGKHTYRAQMQQYRERKARVERDARQALWAERAARRRDLPDPAALLLLATGPRARLWERRSTDPDWLDLRVGTADLPSEVEIDDPSKDAHNRKTRWSAPDVPASVPLLSAGVLGVAGRGDRARQTGAWLTAQLVALHSPAALRVVVLSAAGDDAHWHWVRWLPHTRGGADDGYVAAVGTDDETIARRVSELGALLETRKRALEDRRVGPRALSEQSVVVVMDGARRLRLLPGVVSLLKEGPSVGIRFICLDEDERQLPDEAQAVVTSNGPWLRLRRSAEDTVDCVRPDEVTVAWCERLARGLAPLRDVSGEGDDAAVPGASRLLDVLGIDPPEPAALAAGWKAGGRTTRAVIGEGSEGPFAVDVSRDGPHGLVAGTTGAGKSELLQSIIASLSVGNRPDEMTYVLVDYKGGAAFKDCNRLPHTVGMVTDLDGHLTARALESLGAELRRREHQLAGAGAKDIEDYLSGRRPGDPPMPRLMLVIDEFAALVAELPDFVTGLVDIARRGRSLGVHLVLATQRPAGVVSNDIKSNTNLRIALRVTDDQDSSDVIDAPDAAHIVKSTPGRAYARLGHSSLVPFQTARVGGRPPGAVVADVDVRTVPWGQVGRPVVVPAADGEADATAPTDLAGLVAALREAAEIAGVETPPSPWLPPLDDVVTLDELDVDGPRSDGGLPPLAFGLADVPSEQRREVAAYDVTRGGHLAVVGAPRTGRSTTLRAIAGSVGRKVAPRDLHVYGVDCGNNALLPLLSLPHTGAVVSRDQVDRMSRLTGRLQGEIARRQQLLAAQGFADVGEQRAAAEPDDRLPYLLVLLDRWEGFVASFDAVDSGRLVEAWQQILQEGAGVGVKVVMRVDRSGLVGRVSTLVDDRIVLRLTDPADFSSIGMRAKDVPEHMPPGRGFRSHGLRETQVALLDAQPEGTAQVAALQRIAAESAQRWGSTPVGSRPFRVDPLPATIDLAGALELGEQAPAPHSIPVGVGGDELTLRCFDALEHGPGIIVAGAQRTGRSTALLTMAEVMSGAGWQLVVVAPRRSPLRGLQDAPGMAGVFDGEASRAEVEEALGAGEGRRSALLVDDLELLGQDGPLVDVITDCVARWRDSGNVVVGAGTLEDLNGMYRGPVVALKKGRVGLLLDPRNYNDGDLLGVRLPRSVSAGGAPVGRAVMVAGGAWEMVQIASPARFAGS